MTARITKSEKTLDKIESSIKSTQESIERNHKFHKIQEKKSTNTILPSSRTFHALKRFKDVRENLDLRYIEKIEMLLKNYREIK
jgi:hypothetical protein